MNELLLSDWFYQVSIENMKTSHRSAIILSGDLSFLTDAVQLFLDKHKRQSAIWVSSGLAQGVSAKKIKMHLGKEYDSVIFDAHEEFDIDAFAAVSGTIRGGGILFIIIPYFHNNENYLNKSRFLNRIVSNSTNHNNIYLVNQNKPLPEIIKHEKISCPQGDVEAPYRTVDQKKAVSEIISHVIEQNKFVMVLTSDRGRGKSSSLGLAAGYLLQNPEMNIIVTAPGKSNSEFVFYHAQEINPEVEMLSDKLIYKDSVMEFMAPDSLIDKRPDVNVVLVDEASAIPIPMLEKILDAFPAVIFSTTIHGYEGTGRGFALKFNQILNAKASGWLKCKLETPIRWTKNDPVEHWVNNILCMNADIDYFDETIKYDVNSCKINCIDRDALLSDDKKLTSLFSLLVYAHYRTKPSDLAFMLDSKSIRIYTLELNNKILAVSLISVEGGFSQALSSEIYKGRRRPKGHLLAQTLSFHAGIEFASMLKYSRIMRIAVHPELQRQGLGTYLIEQLFAREKNLGIDAIGSSFGATTELMKFWEKLGFETVRMGFTRDHVSGTHSAVVLKAFSKDGEDVFIASRDKFRSYINVWLSGPLSNLSSSIKSHLEVDLPDSEKELSDYEWDDIKSFAYTHRGYEACMSALMKLVSIYSDAVDDLDELHRQLVYAKIDNGMSWPEVVKELGLAGKNQAIKCLKEAVKILLIKIDISS